MTSDRWFTNLLLARNAPGPPLLLWMIIGVMVVVMLTMVVVFARFFSLWLRAFLSQANIPIPQLIAMKLRKSPVDDIVRLKIMAVQSCVDIPTHEIERAYLQGADAERAVRAMIRAKETGRNVTWEELLSTDHELWLGEHDQP